MPLVRIELQKGKDIAFRRKLGQIVYDAMVATIGIPKDDRFQVITEHLEDDFVFDANYLDIDRSENLIIVQLTISEGRSVAQKQSLYKAIADGLAASLQHRPEDLFINVVEVKKEDWSFGNGIAQYVV